MSEDNPEFRPADLDSNAWYELSDGRVRHNGALCIANETRGTVEIYSPRGEYWQFLRLEEDRPRYALRSNQLGVAKQLAACYVEDEIDDSRTQPCLRKSDGTDEQKWDVHEWDIGQNGGNTTYRLVNVKNGTDYWFDVHPNNPPFLSSVTGSADQKAQQMVMHSVSDIDDGAYSTTFTNMPTGGGGSGGDESTSTTTSSGDSPTSDPGGNGDDDSGSSSSSGLSTGAQAGIGVGVGIAAILIGVIAFLLWRRRRKAKAFAAGTPSSEATTQVAHDGSGYVPPKYEHATGGGYAVPPDQQQQQQQYHQQQAGPVYHEVQGSDSVPTELPADTAPNELPGDQGYNHSRR